MCELLGHVQSGSFFASDAPKVVDPKPRTADALKPHSPKPDEHVPQDQASAAAQVRETNAGASMNEW